MKEIFLALLLVSGSALAESDVGPMEKEIVRQLEKIQAMGSDTWNVLIKKEFRSKSKRLLEIKAQRSDDKDSW